MGKPNAAESAPIQTHFSHPHPLKLSSSPLLSHCHACKLQASDAAAYSCTLCAFVLHKKCFDLPQKIKHEFDRAHVLSLQPKPVYPEGLFRCDACGIQGDGFSYHCTTCGTDLHSICASLPMKLTSNCHHHQLSLIFTAPYNGNAFSCDICKKIGSKTWLYRCNSCEFDVHLTCVAKIPSSAVHTHQTVHHDLSRSISNPPPVVYQANAVGYGVLPPPPVAVAMPYPASMGPVSAVPYNQPVGHYGPVRPVNGLGNQILGNAVNGIASGVAQASAQALIQGLVGGGVGIGGGGGGGGAVSHVDVTGTTTDGGLYVDGGYGGTDVGYIDAGGGDGSYY